MKEKNLLERIYKGCNVFLIAHFKMLVYSGVTLAVTLIGGTTTHAEFIYFGGGLIALVFLVLEVIAVNNFRKRLQEVYTKEKGEKA